MASKGAVNDIMWRCDPPDGKLEVVPRKAPETLSVWVDDE